MVADNRTMLPMFRLSQIDTLRVMVRCPRSTRPKFMWIRRLRSSAVRTRNKSSPQGHAHGKGARPRYAHDADRGAVPNPDRARFPACTCR